MSSGDMAIDTRFRADLTATGTLGTLKVSNPLVPQTGHALELTTRSGTTVEKLDRRPTYDYQMDAFVEAVVNDKPLYTDAEDAVKQMQVIDACYDAAGLPRRGLEL
jgi:predicted dehydrogenase